MAMKDGHDVVKAWLKAELDDYKALQDGIRKELDRVRPASSRQALNLDLVEVLETKASPTPPKASGIGLTMTQAAIIAIPELARNEGFKPKRRNDYENAVKAFVAWSGVDLDLAAITPELVGAFKGDLTYYPARGSIRPAYRDLEWKARVEKARATEEGDVLNAATINTKYLTPLRSIFRFHQGTGLKGKLKENPFDGIAARKKRSAKRDGQRRDFTAREVRTMFSQPMFVGAKGTSQAPLYQRGDLRISDWRYWVPLISFFTGARLNEVCAIAVKDFRVEDGLHYVLIRDLEEGQNNKSDAAWRKVPLHKELVRLRLPDYVALQVSRGATRLFDDLAVDAFGYVSGPPSKFFARLTKSVAEPDPEQHGNLVFHSVRHTVIGRLRSADVRLDVAYQIVGHEEGTVHSGYGGVSLTALKIAVDKIEYEGLELGPVELPVTVLPKSKS